MVARLWRANWLFVLALSACGGSTTDLSTGSDASTGTDSATDGGGIRDVNLNLEDGLDGHLPDVITTPDVTQTDSGWQPDSGGGVPIYHRPNGSQCLQPAPAGDCQLPQGFQCTNDSQCTQGTNGRCIETSGGALTCLCTYDTCMQDTDCQPGQLCVCHGSGFTGGAGNTCMTGNCRVDSDCGPNGYCSPSHGTSGCGGVTGYYCHTAADTCTNDSDCSGAGIEVCAWSGTSNRWECQQELLCP
jgi:hypothetical protein